MFSSLNLQIMIDLIFFITIIILLRQLNKNVSKTPPAIDVQFVDELKKILQESHDAGNQFSEATEEYKRGLSKIFQQLDEKARTLAVLIDEAEACIKKLDSKKNESASMAPEKQYDDVVKMIQQGMNREEIAKRTGFTEGEIDLIMDIARTKNSHIL